MQCASGEEFYGSSKKGKWSVSSDWPAQMGEIEKRENE